MLKSAIRNLLVILSLFMSAMQVCANEKEKQAVLDQKIKLETLRIVKDAAQLVEDIGYPESSRLKIYVAHGPGKFFGLKKVTVILDGADKAEFDYKELQQKALLRGASNRVYIGAVSEGFHEVVAVFEGKDRQGNIIKKAETWLFDKKPGEAIVVLQVSDNESSLRPEFAFNIIKGDQ